MKKVAMFAVAALTLAACQDSTAPVTIEPSFAKEDAPGNSDVIPGRFIVTLRDGDNPADVAREYGVQPDHVYSHALNGFAGAMSEAARGGLMRDARVTNVEPDGIAHTTGTQTSATWGLDRIDQRALPLSTTFTYGANGAGVTAYIIDTGIEITHADFGGRASVLTDKVGDGRNGIDCNGHGTHVAGTVGGATWGVAKGVTLMAVRVLNCAGSGSWSNIIAGIDAVVAHHVAGTPAVSNMSLGGGASSSVDAALNRMITDGVASAVAAGNGNFIGIAQDACKYSPARVAAAMTVGATDITDTKTSFSNYGSCVDWFAPGNAITSAWLNGGTNTISGTSMASPHTAGVAALYLQLNPGASPATVRTALFNNGTKGVVKNSRTTNNQLLYTNY
jgi:subtilisin family serine protease